MASSDKKRPGKLERDWDKEELYKQLEELIGQDLEKTIKVLKQELEDLKEVLEQHANELAVFRPLKPFATAMRMRFFESYKRDAGYEHTALRSPFLEDEVAITPESIVAIDMQPYLDGEPTDGLIFAEIYGISRHEYVMVQDVRGNEEIINRFGTLQARDPAQPLPSSVVNAYLAVVDTCISQLDGKMAWEVGNILADPAHEVFGLKKAFLRLACEVSPPPWQLVV